MAILKRNHVLLLILSSCLSSLTTSFVRNEGSSRKAFIESPTVSDGRSLFWLTKKSELSSIKKADSSWVMSRSHTDVHDNPGDSGGQMPVVGSEMRGDRSGIVGLLRKYNLSSNIEVLDTASNLPVIGEVFIDGRWNLCLVRGFKPPASAKAPSDTSKIKSPRVDILLIRESCGKKPPIDYKNDETFESFVKIVDMGQIISIWPQYNLSTFQRIEECANYLSSQLSAAGDKIRSGMAINRAELSMKEIYEGRVKIRQGGKNTLSKKTINQICSALPSQEQSNHVRQIMQKIRKKARLVTYADACLSLFGSKYNDLNILQSLVGAIVLAKDASLGGRFKRSPCTFVSVDYETSGEPLKIKAIAFFCGGWVVVDESIRATTEARKFVERTVESDKRGEISRGSERKRDILTSADKKLMDGMERLAFEDNLYSEHTKLALSVRQALASMNLPYTPEGAQEALVRVGKWSEIRDTQSKYSKFEPWSKETLNAARGLVDHIENVKRNLNASLSESLSRKEGQMLDGRVSLVSLPSICVDAKRTSFRDDAIGLRPRASTGRKVLNDDSKWEILIHIADVSDIFSPDVISNTTSFDASELQRAASNRGISRYDLPIGPLHLMPPIALGALALDVRKESMREIEINRCVTVWAYIDERNGKLIDAGLERTIVSSPVAMTFSTATSLLEGDHKDLSQPLKVSKSILVIADRILTIWTNRRIKQSMSAQRREERMDVKEMIAKEINQGIRMRDDGSGDSFQRTRGHRLVDSSLDLYGQILHSLLSRAKAPIPQASGSKFNRGGRLGTAPLRRYVDGMAQRQVLSVVSSFGGRPMTQKECLEVTKVADAAMARTNKMRSEKNSGQEESGLQNLASHLAIHFRDDQDWILPALCTGRDNEVMISGTGVTTKCVGVKGSLSPGTRLNVKITKLDVQKRILQVTTIIDK